MIARSLALVALVLLSACGADTETTGADAAPSPAVSPMPDAVDVSTEEQEGGDRDAAMFLNDVTVSSEDGSDRVTFSFEPREGEDARTPYWLASPTEPPLREAGSGQEVEVEGEAFWEITIWATGVDLSGEEFREVYTGPDRITPEGTDVVAEVLKAGDFENTLTFYVGVAEGAGARVVTADDPVRIHVDFAKVQGEVGGS